MIREEIVHTFKANKICEVGVLRGKFAKHLLSTKPDELHLVDPWKKFDVKIFKDYREKTQENWDETYNFVCRKFQNDKEVQIHRMTSLDAARKFPDNYFDLVYIDGNHAYESVKADINAWTSKVKPGGHIGGHDHCTDSVRTAVQEVFGLNYFITTEYIDTDKKKPPKSWFVKL